MKVNLNFRMNKLVEISLALLQISFLVHWSLKQNSANDLKGEKYIIKLYMIFHHLKQNKYRLNIE